MTVRRGEIYFVDLNPVKGREQAGKRPVLILSDDILNRLPLVVTVVVGTKGENISRDYPTNVRVPSSESGNCVFMFPDTFTGSRQISEESCRHSL